MIFVETCCLLCPLSTGVRLVGWSVSIISLLAASCFISLLTTGARGLDTGICLAYYCLLVPVGICVLYAYFADDYKVLLISVYALVTAAGLAVVTIIALFLTLIGAPQGGKFRLTIPMSVLIALWAGFLLYCTVIVNSYRVFHFGLSVTSSLFQF